MNQMRRRPVHLVLRPVPEPEKGQFPLWRVRGLPRDPTLAEWLDHWMAREIEPCRARTTVYGYSNIIRNHVDPAIGSLRLSQVTPGLLEEYYYWLTREQGLSANTARKHHVLLHTSLRAAWRQGLLASNPADLAVPPRYECGTAHFYTPEQLGRLLQLVEGHPLELPVRLACSLGLRRGEILGLRWRDVDLKAGLISVRQTRTTVAHRVVEKAPKTPVSCRTLSIVALTDLTELLREIRGERLDRGLPCGPEDLVVLNACGTPWHPNLLTEAFTDFVSRHKLPPITLHGLRHTFASMASNARVPMYQISRAMGHSSPTTTQRVYTHLFEPTHGEVLAAVAAVMPGKEAK